MKLSGQDILALQMGANPTGALPDMLNKSLVGGQYQDAVKRMIAADYLDEMSPHLITINGVRALELQNGRKAA